MSPKDKNTDDFQDMPPQETIEPSDGAALFHSFMSHLPGLAFIKDEAGRYIYLNEPCRTLLAADSAERIGKTDEEIWPLLIAERLMKNDRQVMESGEALSTIEEIPVAGKLRKHDVTLFPLNGSDRPEKLAGISFDISDRLKAEADKKKLETQLQQSQKMEAIGTLAGGIAHEFNNLLMGIQGNLAIIEMRTEKGHPNIEKVRNIMDLIASGAELTQQLLGFARGSGLNPKPANLNELLKQCIRMFARTRKEVTFHETFEAALWPVALDTGQTDQVFLNLFINAANAMPQGGEIHIETRNAHLDEKSHLPHHLPPGRYIIVTVRDTGVGMDKAMCSRIFEPFFTTGEMGQCTGLGLASAYGIIRDHGGSITARSTPNEGSVFTVHLPAAEETAAGRKKSPETKSTRGTETILFIDDEEYIRNLAAQLLARMGYRVITAESGEQAIEIFEGNKEEIALVVLDLIMPGMGGSRTCRTLKKIDPMCKIIMASGIDIKNAARYPILRECQGCIQKPFGISELAGKIRTMLDGDGESFCIPPTANS